MLNFLKSLYFRSVDKILEGVIAQLAKLEALAQFELAKAQEFEAKAATLQAQATASTAHADRAQRVAQKLKDLVS